MKSTEMFSQIIESHLQGVAKKDPLFAVNLEKKNKTIEGCVSYILHQVQKSGRQGFADEEVFNMAIHYYDEDNIKEKEAPNCRVVVNRPVESKKKKAKTMARKKVKEQAAESQYSLF